MSDEKRDELWHDPKFARSLAEKIQREAAAIIQAQDEEAAKKSAKKKKA